MLIHYLISLHSHAGWSQWLRVTTAAKWIDFRHCWRLPELHRIHLFGACIPHHCSANAFYHVRPLPGIVRKTVEAGPCSWRRRSSNHQATLRCVKLLKYEMITINFCFFLMYLLLIAVDIRTRLEYVTYERFIFFFFLTSPIHSLSSVQVPTHWMYISGSQVGIASAYDAGVPGSIPGKV